MSYLYFIGIDVSKDTFHVALHNSTKIDQFPNTPKGFSQFLASIEHPINQYFITLEATGGYETNLLIFLCQQGFATHRLQTLKSSHYLRSLRVFGKNDILDSQALARFGAERHDNLPIFVPQTQEMQHLQTLRMRRDDHPVCFAATPPVEGNFSGIFCLNSPPSEGCPVGTGWSFLNMQSETCVLL